ncbi:MAG: PQQ-dependent sugar dehydrogenase [Pyrinomonadaceae bacterium]|nr:PQQ-dependent sugar dehydrogenase [Pyrinomonadaceae bacterium]
MSTAAKLKFEKARLIILPSLLCAFLGFVLSSNSVHQPAQAFSSGPPPGYTRAPGEEPEACAECHVTAEAGTGQISIEAPSTYVPNQSYQITVRHTNADPTRLRWGFQLTVLDGADEKAGNLQSTDALTQVLNNAGPGNARQYIEHGPGGTFVGQQGGASWTFNWTAPATDVGTVLFYAAGNQANNDDNSSGDHIYSTFVASSPASTTPDFTITATPASRFVTPGNGAQYTVTITPFAGFTGAINLSASGLPSGATASFNPTSVNITDATSKSATLTVNTTAGTPLGDFQITVTGTGATQHSAAVTLKVISPSNIDLALAKTASPNPGQVGLNLAYRLTVTNNGPATATNVNVSDTLPAGVTLGTVTPSQGTCVGTATVSCALGSLPVGASAVITINVTPTTAGSIINNANVSASETDFDTSNNSATVTTFIQAAAASPLMLDDNLTVSTVLNGLDQPTSLAFVGANEFFVLERATGRVQRVLNGALQGAALDLNVNSFSERGLLGIALHPQFAQNGFVYLFWTESSTGADTANVDDIALLGNRVDRYLWNGSGLAFDRNLIKLRAQQEDGTQQHRGNHNGGVLRFGQDGKLYIIVGDNGRRGLLQNITSGGPVPDDQFGGPEPDDAHLTGVILRLNDDGSTPADNPFFNANSGLSGQAAANVKKLFAYGIRNSFGMAVDPITGNFWTQENGDDAFDELNRVRPGFNGGWIQAMGPINRVAEFKAIETTYGIGTLQQVRWPPSNIADTAQAALTRLYMLPGAQYSDPEFSWKYAVAPSPIGFVHGRGLGPQFEGDLFVGASRTTLSNGYLFRFKMSADRQHFAFTDPDLSDLVADNADKFDLTESESLLIGRDFGVTTDIQTGPNGNLFVVSLSNGAVYEIKSKPSLLFTANLNGAQEVPPTASAGTGAATLLLSPDEKTARLSLNFSGISGTQTDAHIHGPAPAGSTASALFPLPLGQLSDFEITLTPTQVQDLKSGLFYINVHSATFPTGDIRGQLQTSASASAVQFAASKLGVGEGEGSVSIVVNRIGDSSTATSVGYATGDTAGSTNCNALGTGAASSRCDYAPVAGSLQFAPGEASKNLSIPIVDDAYAEGGESFTVALSNPAGSTLGSPNVATVTINDNETVNGANPIDQTAFFVRQHYLDFLNREPDAVGFPFWTNEIDSCGNNQACIEIKRINVSAAFFLSIEFQETGYLVYRMYKTAFANLPPPPSSPVPIRLNEFLPDTQEIGQGVVVGSGNWQALLESNKQAFAVNFVSRPRFIAAFPTSMTPGEFVNLLFANAAVVPTTAERNAAVNEFGSAVNSANVDARARALRLVSEHATLKSQEFNRAFVLMQYFGYLRRNPYDPPEPTLDFAGYNFWLNKLNQFNGNYINAEMVKAFITSTEYRQRFGP